MQQLTKDQKNRVESCREAIDGVLDNYKCQLVPQLIIMQGQIVSHQVGIVPAPEENRIIVPKINEKKVQEKMKNGA